MTSECANASSQYIFDDTYSYRIGALNESYRSALESPVDMSTTEREYLTKRQFVTSGKKTKESQSSRYLSRITYFNGGVASYSFSHWKHVLQLRANDIRNRKFSFSNDIAYSDEGIRAFFELDFRYTNTEIGFETILKQTKTCQTVIRRFFESNTGLDLKVLTLTCSPKPKFITGASRPVIASGAHIIFPNVTINANQGHQLCLAVDLAIQREFGYGGVVDDCYKESKTMLRPWNALKMVACPVCMDDKHEKTTCTRCRCRGKVRGVSSYCLKAVTYDDGKVCFGGPLDALVKTDLGRLVSESCIVPENDTGVYTAGYARPRDCPEYIPCEKRTRNTRIPKSVTQHVFRNDRVQTGNNYTVVEDPAVLDIIQKAINAYHPLYRQTLVGMVSRTNKYYFVNLRGPNKSMCRIRERSGYLHAKNRIYFKITYKGRYRITQHCYDNECKKLLCDKETREWVASEFTGNIARLFPEKFENVLPRLANANAKCAKRKLGISGMAVCNNMINFFESHPLATTHKKKTRR